MYKPRRQAPKKPACRHFDLGLIAFRIVRTQISIVYAKKKKKKLSHRSSSTSSTKIVSRGFSSDAYSKFKFFLTGIILQNAVCEIINMLCEFVLLSWEQCKIDSIRTPVFQRHKLAAVNPKSCVSITAPGERKIDRDFPKFNTDLETLHIIKIESRS